MFDYVKILGATSLLKCLTFCWEKVAGNTFCRRKMKNDEPAQLMVVCYLVMKFNLGDWEE